MKKHFGVLALALVLFPMAASAASLKIDSNDVKALPEVKVTGVHVWNGGGLAAVQPTATLEYMHESCSGYALDASTEEIDGVLLVSLSVPPMVRECRGPARFRSHRVQIGSDFTGLRVLVLNPTATN